VQELELELAGTGAGLLLPMIESKMPIFIPSRLKVELIKQGVDQRQISVFYAPTLGFLTEWEVPEGPYCILLQDLLDNPELLDH
jgi:hypothetical protein